MEDSQSHRGFRPMHQQRAKHAGTGSLVRLNTITCTGAGTLQHAAPRRIGASGHKRGAISLFGGAELLLRLPDCCAAGRGQYWTVLSSTQQFAENHMRDIYHKHAVSSAIIVMLVVHTGGYIDPMGEFSLESCTLDSLVSEKMKDYCMCMSSCPYPSLLPEVGSTSSSPSSYSVLWGRSSVAPLLCYSLEEAMFSYSVPH
ncbi:hypothetical protein F5884DRAFT_744900 [Xylogone sp. PMI_703]|nr:hypothetical protein F5884DRAFT_744900 [Xylogone sp. PMI_703]